MKSSLPWLALAVGLVAGCGERGGFNGGGLVFDRSQFEENAGPDEDRRADREVDRRGQGEPRRERRSDAGGDWRRDDPRDDASWSSNESRPHKTRAFRSDEDESADPPSDSLTSRTGRWGKDRSMPSDEMPSRTEKWGKDRETPSDSMPSRRETWGSDRKMPSDSMPGRTFPRRTDPSEESDQ